MTSERFAQSGWVSLLMILGGILAAAADEPVVKKQQYALAVHGGAGVKPARLSPEKREAVESAMRSVAKAGESMLREGKTALEVVEYVVRQLEDDPLFNAGRGAVFNSAGEHELDASIMDGKTKQCGAVAGVRIVKNPISLARLVMTKTPHILLAADGADKFAHEMLGEQGIQIVENSHFSTADRREEWMRARARGEQQRVDELRGDSSKTQGTVGCVALDRDGNLAAATSTGGLTNKKYGRVGDSPIIGAGNYADNATCAVSCTGTGEYFMRHAIAFHATALMAYEKLELDPAINRLLSETLPKDVGGIIAVDREGNLSLRTNTSGMPRALADWKGRFEVAIEP